MIDILTYGVMYKKHPLGVTEASR